MFSLPARSPRSYSNKFVFKKTIRILKMCCVWYYREVYKVEDEGIPKKVQTLPIGWHHRECCCFRPHPCRCVPGFPEFLDPLGELQHLPDAILHICCVPVLAGRRRTAATSTVCRWRYHANKPPGDLRMVFVRDCGWSVRGLWCRFVKTHWQIQKSKNQNTYPTRFFSTPHLGTISPRARHSTNEPPSLCRIICREQHE